MVNLLLAWFIMAVIVVLTAAIVPGVNVRSFGTALWVALLFGFLNAVLGWFLFVIVGVGTLGIGFLLAFLTRWLVDAILLKMVAAISDGLTIESFGKAFLAAMVMGGLGTLAEWFIHV